MEDVYSGGTLTATTPIVGEGKVRVKIKGFMSKSSGGESCPGEIYVQRGTSKELIYSGYTETNFDLWHDVSIQEGDYVGVHIRSAKGGVVAGPVFSNMTAGIYTSSNNGILAYIGDIATTTKTEYGGR